MNPSQLCVCTCMCGGGRFLYSHESKDAPWYEHPLREMAVYMHVCVCECTRVYVCWSDCVCFCLIQRLNQTVCVPITLPTPWGQFCHCLFMYVGGMLVVFSVWPGKIKVSLCTLCKRFLQHDKEEDLFFNPDLFREPVCALVPRLQTYARLPSVRSTSNVTFALCITLNITV